MSKTGKNSKLNPLVCCMCPASAALAEEENSSQWLRRSDGCASAGWSKPLRPLWDKRGASKESSPEADSSCPTAREISISVLHDVIEQRPKVFRAACPSVRSRTPASPSLSVPAVAYSPFSASTASQIHETARVSQNRKRLDLEHHSSPTLSSTALKTPKKSKRPLVAEAPTVDSSCSSCSDGAFAAAAPQDCKLSVDRSSREKPLICWEGFSTPADTLGARLERIESALETLLTQQAARQQETSAIEEWAKLQLRREYVELRRRALVEDVLLSSSETVAKRKLVEFLASSTQSDEYAVAIETAMKFSRESLA